MPALELRPRTGTEIVDAAFQLYRRYFGALITLTLIVYGPYVVVQYVLQSQLASDPLIAPLVLLAFALVAAVVASLSEAAIVLAVSNSYLHGEPDIGTALGKTVRRAIPILFAVLIKYVLILLALLASMFLAMIPVFLVLFFAGIGGSSGSIGQIVGAGLAVLIVFLVAVPFVLNVFARYFAVPATLILEGLGIFAGLGRSNDLSTGFKRKISATVVVPYVLLTVIGGVVTLLAQFLVPGSEAVRTLIAQVPVLLLTPIVSVITTLMYYDLRIRKEGFDIQVMAAELGSPLSDPALPQVPASSG